MTTCRDPDILVEVFPDRLLAVQTKRLLNILEPVVYTPEIKGNVLAQVTQNDLQLGVTVEDAVGDHAQDVKGDTLREGERWADEPLAVLPKLFKYGACGVARVQVEGHVQFCAGLPEDIPFGLVVEDQVVAILS